ncbi:DNA alkylation repair protein [Anaerovorax odorimutans]|uniref:DNA alkylation repair protein n=1 Tax=Anaerovorax odorimutans TaxID=109327 RepID=A0ABT1RMQ6_9FIRM|nr:DNA alkylation repair protein [Anaerovorax odorimutans]MCQ4636474.1 DNA alkylation repair protein [Anaerovorax odorimutans]
MPELLKNKYYNRESLHELALRIKAVYPLFQVDDFLSGIMDETWDGLELKARVRKIAINLGTHLPADYEQALGIIDKVIAGFPIGFNDYALVYFPDFVEVYGQDERYLDLSIVALERYTISSSSEFAVRPFIVNHEERMMRQMAIWARHDNEHVRRLASEGCRPRLPWGQALPSFQRDPSPVLRILEQLKADPSPYVRKSVANNLNDISKTHPDLVAKTAKAWYGKNQYTDWIIKHGCRTLLKKGNREVLNIFGFSDTDCVKVDSFALSAESVSIGEDITFSFAITAKKATKVRLEYGIDYVKANGKRSRKVFQISEISLKENQEKAYTKSHSFADLSSRKHYPGIHSIALIINGAVRENREFEVLAAE